MATSPDFLRLASSSTRAVADTALDHLPDAVLVVDARHKHLPIVLASAAARKSLISPADPSVLIEAPLLRFLAPESLAHCDEALRQLDIAPQLTRTLTWRSVERDLDALTAIQLLPGSNGQRLVMLNFGAPAAAPALAMALERMPRCVVLVDTHLNVTYANSAAAQAFGIGSGDLVGMAARTLVPISAVHPEIFARALEGRAFHDDSLVVVRPGEGTRWFEMDIQRLDEPLTVAASGLLVLFTEVTERHAQLRAQGGLERRLLALTEHARDIISIADVEGRVEYVSGGVRNSLGYTSEERRSNYIFEHMHPDDYPEICTKFQQLVRGEIDAFSKEVRVRHKDGSYRWLESSYSSALKNPLIGGIVINSRDVTERKHAEFRLAQREEVARLAADAVDGMIFEWDITRGIVQRSRGVQEVLGLSPEDLEVSTDAWLERVHPRDVAAARRVVKVALLNGRGWTTTYRMRDAQGRYRSILERAMIQRNAAGDPVRAIGCCVDVSEIKRLTDLLADTQRTAKIGGWEYAFASRALTWTEETYRIYDTSPREFQVSWTAMLDRCLAEDADRLRHAWAEAEAGNGHVDLELQIMTLRGQKLWVRLIGHIEILDGKPFRAYGSVQDILAQKLAQIALESSTSWLKLSMNMAHLHAWRWDRGRDSFEFMTLEGQQVHLPSIYPSMKAMQAKVHPRDQIGVARAIERAFAEGAEVREEFRLQGSDGRYRTYASTARPVFDANESPSGLVGVIQDVTGLKDSERRLRESEELLRNTTANTADTLLLVDTILRVKFINRSVNGLPIADITGRDICVLLPERAQVAVIERLRKVLATGEPATYEFEAPQDGQLRHFESHAVLVREDGIGTGISISVRDITERKRLEAEILNVAARERQSIGRDLHDGLGQELTGVALMLRGVATKIKSRCPDVVKNIDEVVNLVNQSIESARGLARGLLPVRTETGGIATALRTLAARSRDLYGLKVNYRDDIAPQFALDEESASHLYRITQEALTNAARHGRASRVDVIFIATCNQFSLKIADDGQGFSKAVPSNGMGLKIMKYRAGMIGARFEVEASEPRGTVVTVISERPVPGSIQSVNAISGANNDGSQQRVDSFVGISGSATVGRPGG